MLGDIVEGCMAVVIMPEPFSINTGRVVRVGKFLGYLGPEINPDYNDNWEVNPPVHYDDGNYRPIMQGRFMKRIDEPEGGKEAKESVDTERKTDYGRT